MTNGRSSQWFKEENKYIIACNVNGHFVGFASAKTEEKAQEKVKQYGVKQYQKPIKYLITGVYKK